MKSRGSAGSTNSFMSAAVEIENQLSRCNDEVHVVMNGCLMCALELLCCEMRAT